MRNTDWFTEGFAAAVSDVREKLVEEAWFGKPITAPNTSSAPGFAEALGWTTAAREAPNAADIKNPGEHVHERGIDR